MGKRQAVVVIHGMGEQEPGDTLNQMSEAILAPRTDDVSLWVSRPDKVTDGYDARRLLAFADGDRIQTEIYEYHWAHLLPGNKLGDLVPLLKSFVFNSPRRVPTRLRIFYFVLWIVLILVVGVAGGVVLYSIVEGTTVTEVLTGFGVSALLIAGVLQVVKLVNRWLTSSFVDVARYLDAAPSNQKARDDIRRGAVDLLAGLHESGRYSRIIIVAHSLGSFVAYDALTFLWARMNQAHRRKPACGDASLRHFEEVATSLVDGNADVAEFQEAQRALWEERRLCGSPWLVTDFVSVGSPMAHSQILLTRKRADLDARQASTEVPTSPPRREIKPRQGDDPYSVHYIDRTSGQPVIYHGAPFAVIRWTNIWFPTDLFGGPLAPIFGPGIEDVSAVQHGFGQKIPFYSHTGYFDRHSQTDTEPGGAVDVIRKAVLLGPGSWIPDTRDILPPTEHPWPKSADDRPDGWATFAESPVSVPISIDAIRTVDGQSMVRGVYFVVTSEVPWPDWMPDTGWHIEFPKIHLLGSAGVIYGPASAALEFTTGDEIHDVFDVVEANEHLSVEFEDVMIPCDWFEGPHEGNPGDVYRVPLNTFQAAYRYRTGVISVSELHRLDTRESCTYSEHETAAFKAWSRAQIDDAIANFAEKDATMKLTIRDLPEHWSHRG